MRSQVIQHGCHCVVVGLALAALGRLVLDGRAPAWLLVVLLGAIVVGVTAGYLAVRQSDEHLLQAIKVAEDNMWVANRLIAEIGEEIAGPRFGPAWSLDTLTAVIDYVDGALTWRSPRPTGPLRVWAHMQRVGVPFDPPPWHAKAKARAMDMKRYLRNLGA